MQDPDQKAASELLTEDLDLDELAPPGQRPGPDQVRTRGAIRQPLFAEYERDLTEADLEALASIPRGSAAPTLVSIRASHHSLARCLAAGMTPQQAGLVTGYSPSRISILQNDPAFTALVADYKREAQSVFADLGQRMAGLSLDAMDLLQERLSEHPESFTIPVLLELVKTFADRTGHGPGQDVNVRVSSDLIDRPPRENFEEWQARRDRELLQPPQQQLKKLN